MSCLCAPVPPSLRRGQVDFYFSPKSHNRTEMEKRNQSSDLSASPSGSRLFTEVKPCWTGLISGWVSISIKYPVLYSLGSQAGIVDINHAFHLYKNVVCGSSFSRSQPDFGGFLRALRFPPSGKLTPSLIQYAGPH